MLNVGQIEEGFVLDHIKAGMSLEIYHQLQLDKLDCTVAIIKNARSNKMGKKDILKVECDINMLDLDVLAFIDHNITVNVIKDGEIIIVDEFTGRVLPGRRWSDGLHQAVEAKEGVEIEKESQTLATITFQNLFRMYEKLAGMTTIIIAQRIASVQDADLIVVMDDGRIIETGNHESLLESSEIYRDLYYSQLQGVEG